MTTYTPQQIQAIKEAVAEVDGWKFGKLVNNIPRWFDEKDELVFGNETKSYTTSYDAIIPLVVKWCGDDEEKWKLFFEALTGFNNPIGLNTSATIRLLAKCFKKIPLQLCIGLLRAAGKLPEGIEP